LRNVRDAIESANSLHNSLASHLLFAMRRAATINGGSIFYFRQNVPTSTGSISTATQITSSESNHISKKESSHSYNQQYVLWSTVKDNAEYLRESAASKLGTMQALGGYVSNMAGNFFDTEYLRQKVVKAGMQVKKGGDSVLNENADAEASKIPKFKIRQQNFVSQIEIDKNTMFYMARLKEAIGVGGNNADAIQRFDEFNRHLSDFPFAKGLATKLGAIPDAIKAERSEDLAVRLAAKETLTRLGVVNPLPMKGIRILSIDGGGMKGVIALEVLRRMEAESGKRIHELFDFMVGVSTGSIIVALLAFKKLAVADVESIYNEVGKQVFKQTYLGGITGIVKSHSYYDTAGYQRILQGFTGDLSMAGTSRLDGPKVAMIGSLVSDNKGIVPYVFRNYNFPAMVTSNYRGSVRYKVWEAVRASSAAPGYFDECLMNKKVFQDGGMSSNNSTHIAIHEAQQLWPGEPLQSVVSIGLGKYDPLQFDYELNDAAFKGLSLSEKFNKLVWSATDTETVHNTLHDLLPPKNYSRFNPHLSEMYPLDEIRPEKTLKMTNDAKMYCRRNRDRLNKTVDILMENPTLYQKAKRRMAYQQLEKSPARTSRLLLSSQN